MKISRMIGIIIVIIIVTCFNLPTISASNGEYFNEKAPPSLADHLHLKPAKDPIDAGWLPNINGLPDEFEVFLMSRRIELLMALDKEKNCRAIERPLKMMMFEHFLIYQHMANQQNIYFDEKIAYQWAHVLAMILKESSGDTAAVTDMRGNEMSVFKAQTTLNNWWQIAGLSKHSHIPLNEQTNFGLTQTSADRLISAFHLAQNQQYNTEFLEGLEGANTPRKIKLNTAIAIRRLIWFYQDFAQGRLTQNDKRIHHRDINNPQFAARIQDASKMALLYCGSRYLFAEGNLKEELEGYPQLKKAMSSIAYCKLGNYQTGYGLQEIDERCFAQWVTLCPALNIDISTLTPLNYFATKNEKPVCEGIFKALINHKPK